MQLPPGITSRPITAADAEFLCTLYASTREEELKVVDWPRERVEAFLRQQFEAQHHHYMNHYVGAQFNLLLAAGEPIGRFYVARWASEIRLIDIALLPAWRGRGTGTALVRQLLAEGEASGKVVSIHVEMFNPALHLYERLGFEHVSDYGVYRFLRWTPPGLQVNTAS